MANRYSFPNVKVSKNKAKTLGIAEHDSFPWGRILAIHQLGEHRIIEYLERGRKGCTITQVVSDTLAFHIDGDSYSCDTLEEAIITAIARKHQGPNTQAAHFFMKMIKQD